MRFPTLPTLIRTFTLTNLTASSLTTLAFRNPPATSHRLPQAIIANHRTLWSMPTVTSFLGSLFGGGASPAKTDMADYPVQKSDDEWQAVLSPEQFRVIRGKGTEAPYTGEYDKHMPAQGTYVRFLFFSFPFLLLTYLSIS